MIHERAFWTMTAAAVLLAVSIAPGAARADVPSYATGQESISGSIAALPARYALTLTDDRGFSDSVTLRDGTVIVPTGITLAVGQAVTIYGHTDGTTFDADEIDVGPVSSDIPGDAPNTAGGYYFGPYGGNAYPQYFGPSGPYGFNNGFFNGFYGWYGAPFGPCCFAGPGYFYYAIPVQNGRNGRGGVPVTPHTGIPVTHPPAPHRVSMPVSPHVMTGVTPHTMTSVRSSGTSVRSSGGSPRR